MNDLKDEIVEKNVIRAKSEGTGFARETEIS
jgi:hypothetical protein